MSARSIPLPRLRVPAARPVAPRSPHARRRLLAVLAVAGLVVATFLIVRESSLVAVRDVEVTGVAGREGERIRGALQSAAQDMTTLHVDVDALRTAVAPYPIVKDVRATPDFPHGLRIDVVEHVPVAAVGVDGRRVPVASDGTLLRGSNAKGLPVLPLRTPPAGDRVPAGQTARVVAALGAAPAPLRETFSKVFVGPRGLTVRLTAGPALYLGTTERIAAKWAAVARVLADPSSRGATYLDVRLPERPTAGGLEQVAAQQQQTLEAGATAPGAAVTGAAGATGAAVPGASSTDGVTP